VLNDCPITARRALIFNAPIRASSGELEVALVMLGVCPLHESAVEEFGMSRAVSEGLWVSLDNEGDLERMVRANARVAPEMITNVHGPLLVA
jgi:hypothetical protein